MEPKGDEREPRYPQRTPASRRRGVLGEEVVDYVRELILTGTIRSGEKIDQQAVSEALGVSRSPIREALVVLGREGLVELTPRRGAAVADLSPEDIVDHYALFGVVAGRAAALAAAAAWIGGLISQWPAGRISDHFDRRVVIAAMGAIASLAALVLGLMPGLPSNIILVALAVWGAGSLSFYGIGVAHAIDRAEAPQIARVMAGLLFVWAFGSVIGPPLSGFAFNLPFTQGGLFLLAAILSALLSFSMLWRRASRKDVPQEDQEPWNIALPSTAEVAEIDPRTE